jgi:iron complex outermembrane receptor protein
MWESEEAGAKVGLEAYWTGTQRLDDHPFRAQSPDYWITGLMAEKGFGRLRLFVNFENFLDTRQTRFDPIVVGDPRSGPVRTLPIYAPLEGRVINGGIRFVL